MLFVWYIFTEYAVHVKVIRVKILLCPSSRILLRLVCIENLGLSMKTDYQLFIQESAIKDAIHTSPHDFLTVNKHSHCFPAAQSSFCVSLLDPPIFPLHYCACKPQDVFNS